MKKLVFLLFHLAIFLPFSCQQSNSSATQTETASAESEAVFVREVVSAERFKEKMAAYPNAQLIDVRTPEEFANGHIEGAKNINVLDKSFETDVAKLDKKTPVLVYCQSGGRSGRAAKKLQEMEFQTIYDLSGGYSEWPK